MGFCVALSVGLQRSHNAALPIYKKHQPMSAISHGAHGTLQFSILHQDRAYTRAHTHTHAHTHTTRTRALVRPHSRSLRTCARTHTHTYIPHTHTRTHARAHVLCICCTRTHNCHFFNAQHCMSFSRMTNRHGAETQRYMSILLLLLLLL